MVKLQNNYSVVKPSQDVENCVKKQKGYFGQSYNVNLLNVKYTIVNEIKRNIYPNYIF